MDLCFRSYGNHLETLSDLSLVFNISTIKSNLWWNKTCYVLAPGSAFDCRLVTCAYLGQQGLSTINMTSMPYVSTSSIRKARSPTGSRPILFM